MVVYIWKNVGYSSIIYISNIAGIDKGIYEAAKIDGAGKFRQIVNITPPDAQADHRHHDADGGRAIFNSRLRPFLPGPMNSGTLYSTTQTIDTYVYRALMERNDIGMSAAAGFLQSIVGFVLVVGATCWSGMSTRTTPSSKRKESYPCMKSRPAVRRRSRFSRLSSSPF